MSKFYVNKGQDVDFIAPSGGVVAGRLYVINNLVVLAHHTAAENEKTTGAVGEVWEFNKTSADTPAQFANAYWNSTQNEVTTTATGNTLVGVFMEAYANGDVRAQVRLNGRSI